MRLRREVLPVRERVTSEDLARMRRDLRAAKRAGRDSNILVIVGVAVVIVLDWIVRVWA